MDDSSKTGYLLMNIGTPSEPTVKGVRTYLKEFLSDPDVIDTNPILRWIIVNMIVAPLRPKRVVPQYKSIWTEEGSPLLVNSEKFAFALNRENQQLKVEVGMRYGQPSIDEAINRLLEGGIDKIILCPMFPQYAQATTGSCISYASKILDKKSIKYETITEFFREEFYIKSVREKIENSQDFHQSDLLLFSFHGLPERQIRRLDSSGNHCLVNEECCNSDSQFNKLCYRFHCQKTVRDVMSGIVTDKPYQICFQSRFGLDKWIQPDILNVLQECVDRGIKNIAVSCPSFVADCLETLEEISIRDREYFQDIGGESLNLIPSLNTSSSWVSGFANFLYNKY